MKTTEKERDHKKHRPVRRKPLRAGAVFVGSVFFFALVISTLSVSAQTVSGQRNTIYDSPYVSVTADGKAWTTNAKDRNVRWYSLGEQVETGLVSSLRPLRQGEHYYFTRRLGMIPVGRWQVQWEQGQCIHNSYPKGENLYHGVPFRRQVCQKLHYSGWIPYCADCGEMLDEILVYMSREAALSIHYLKVGDGMSYYYLCPFCSNLEQGNEYQEHYCKAVSYNQYQVRYDANCSDYDGFMENSIHMYQNADVYEGKKVSPATRLSFNRYVRTGYVFTGWNTVPEGTGKSFSDGEEILNLTDQDCHMNGESGVVTLYAQWKALSGTLRIDPAGGSYQGSRLVCSVTQDYGTVYTVDTSGVQPPSGHRVSFETNGGNSLPDITGTMHFTEWKLEQPFCGSFQNDRYWFVSRLGEEDLLTASYDYDSVILPTAVKEGSSFGGWYYDEALELPAGAAGDRITPTADITLYAKWVELVLKATDNYRANGGKGAVDLAWSQPDSTDKWYLLYQSLDGKCWKRIFSETDIGEDKVVEMEAGYTGRTGTFTVSETGLYTLTAAGAQGGSYGDFAGGKGGSVEASFWLEKGEVLTYVVGGSNGYNGGGRGNMYTSGGGCTMVSSDRKGLLLVAGGGGGATSAGAGGAGGSLEGLLSAGYDGEAGGAGGGGGYRGGMAGEQILHHHTRSCRIDTSYNGLTETVVRDEYNSHVDAGHDQENDECGDCYQYALQRAGNRVNLMPVKGNTSVEVQAMLWKQICRGGELWEDSCLKVYDQNGICFFSRDLSNILHNSNVLMSQMIQRQVRAWEQGGNMIFPRFSTEFIWLLPEKDDNEEDNGGYTKYWSVRNEDGTSEILGEFKENGGAPVRQLWGKAARGDYPLYPDITFRNTGDTGYHLENTPLFFVRNNGCNESGVLLNELIDIPAGTTGIYVEVLAKGEPAESHDVVKALITGIRFQGGTQIVCGMQEGQVISSKPSYGGSSYVNEAYAYYQSQQAGVQKSNGKFSLKSVSVGYMDQHTMEGVSAPDLAAPYAVAQETVKKEGLGMNRTLVTWQEPEDRGTRYYHVAESYYAGDDSPLCRSNETVNTLRSGIKGYFYCVDENSDTNVTSMSKFTEETGLEIPVKDTMQYLHIAAADVAGNLSHTVHIPVNAQDMAWPLHTKQLSVSGDGGNLYSAGNKTWYVRSDGVTPFTLGYEAYIDGTASESYQINHAVFAVSGEAGNAEITHRLYLQNQPLSAGRIAVPEAYYRFLSDGPSLISYYPYTDACRDDNNRVLHLEQSFVMEKEASGRKLRICPRAGAEWEETVMYSAGEEDALHGLTLIGDGEPPRIQGLELLREMTLIDRRVADPVLNVTAKDLLSGVREFYLTVCNSDNNCEKRFDPDEAGLIQIKLTEEDQLFSGDFTVIARAVDNVGNEITLSEDTTEFGLTARIERILSPHDPVFQNGESGILYLTVWGYPDSVEIEFPKEMTDQDPMLNKKIEYAGSPKYCQEEQLQFMIPLYTPANADYTVTVRAYKGEKRLEQYPELSVVGVSGTVLDDFRTRLR